MDKELVSPFYEDEATQKYYSERVKVIIGVVKSIYGDSFNLDVFLPKVQELARCEISIRYYGKLIANGGEDKKNRSALREDRQREAVLWEHLGLKMAGIEKSADRRDSKEYDNFEEHLMDMMEEAEADDALHFDGLKDEDTVQVIEHRGMGSDGALEIPVNEPVPPMPVDIHKIKVKDIKEHIERVDAEDGETT